MLLQRARKSQNVFCNFKGSAANKSIRITIQRDKPRANHKHTNPVSFCGSRYSPVRRDNRVFIHYADRTAGIALLTGD